MRTISAAEFKSRCLALMDEAAATGETFIITKRGKPVAELRPANPRPASLFGFARHPTDSCDLDPRESPWSDEAQAQWTRDMDDVARLDR